MIAKRGNDEVEQLLAEGLDLFGRGRAEEAIVCWRRVLELVPNHPEALDYLHDAGADSREAFAPLSSGVIDLKTRLPRPAALPRNDVQAEGRHILELIKARRYEEALEALYEARSLRPTDPSLSRSIRHIKGRLLRRYLRSLGGLDACPSLCSQRLPEASWTEEEQEVLKLIDGISTYGDIVDISTLGRFQTLKVLRSLVERDIVATTQLSEHEPFSDELPSTTGMALPGVEGSSGGADWDAALEPDHEAEPKSDLHEPEILAPRESTLQVTASKEPAALAESDERDEYQAAFDEAMEAYLDHSLHDAARLFRRCLELQPESASAEWNLRKIRSLLGEGDDSDT